MYICQNFIVSVQSHSVKEIGSVSHYSHWQCFPLFKYPYSKPVFRSTSCCQSCLQSCFPQICVLWQVDCVNLCGDTSGATEAKLHAAFSQAEVYSPCVLLMKDIELLGRDRDGLGEDSRVILALRHLLLDSQTNARYGQLHQNVVVFIEWRESIVCGVDMTHYSQ